MNPSLNLGKGRMFLLLFSLPFLAFLPVTPTRYAGAETSLLISGTSTLHDWTMESTKAFCTAIFTVDQNGQISSLTALGFSTQSTSLKSGHSAMDNNAYKALKTDKNPLITYTMTSVTIAAGQGSSTLTCKGQLTIAGASRSEDVVATCKPGPDNTILVTGTKKISMKDYQIEPPTFAFGTVKTGNDIVLTFHLTLKKA